MRRDHSVGVGGLGRVGLCGAARASGEAVVHQGSLLVRRHAVRVHPGAVHAPGAVVALWLVRRREAPVAVSGLGHPVEDLRLDRARVIRAPAVRCPRLLGHEQRRHQRLEHRAAPGGHELDAVVDVGALEHVDAEVAPRGAHRLGLLPGPVARVRERAPASEVLLLRQLPAANPDVVDDAALADHGVVAAGRRGGVVGAEVEQHPVHVGPVVEAEVHRVVERPGAPGQLRNRPLDDLEAHCEPAVVHRGQDRVEVRVMLGRPVGELLAGAVVVPVVVLTRVPVALHVLERLHRARQALHELALRNEAEPLRGHRAPHVRADVGGGGLDARAAVAVQNVGGQAGGAVGHRDERRPRAASRNHAARRHPPRER